jgi:hypothetical protein
LGAQGLSRIKSFFPFFAFTLSRKFGIPRRCRVTLQPRLGGYSSISFVGLQGAQAFVFKPDSSGSSRFFIGTIANAGTANRQEPQSILFLLKNHRFQLKREACIKQEVSSRFALLRFASSYLVAAG